MLVILMKKIYEILTIFCVGLIGYPLLEILWRGYTHWSMALTGGICFLTVYLIFNRFPKVTNWIKCLFGALVITIIEFTVGCVVNLCLGWEVWNYAKFPGNILGQVCPSFFLLWAILCVPIIYLSGLIRKTYFSS